MDKTRIIVGVVILAIIVGAGVFMMSGSKGKAAPVVMTQPETLPSQTASTAKAGLVGDTTAVKVYDVLIKNMGFVPPTITIKTGDTVTWTNKDSALHSVISDSGNELASSNLATEGTYYHKFLTPGNYSYHCGVYPLIKGVVIVQ